MSKDFYTVDEVFSSDVARFSNIYKEEKTSSLPKKYSVLLETCKCLNTQTFLSDLKNVQDTIRDPSTPDEIKLILGTWLFRKLYVYYKVKMPVKKEMTDFLTVSIRNVEFNDVLKGQYIHYHDIDAMRFISEHFFFNRFNPDTHFILQMLNDVQLINTTLVEDIKSHFIDWIRRAPLYEQQSNLLDVLLRHFPTDPEVQTIYEKMMFGDKLGSRHVKNLYTNEQNAHNETISKECLNSAVKLILWYKQHPYELKAGEVVIDVVEKYLIEHGLSDIHAQSVLTRAKMDNTLFIGFSIMDLFISLVKYISLSPYECELLQRFHQEMVDISGLCSSGYINRFVNVLQGFDPEFTIHIDFETQLHAVLTHQISKENISDDIILGSYVPEMKGLYLDFIRDTVNNKLKYLQDTYGEKDVDETIVKAVKKMTHWDYWKLEGGMVVWEKEKSVDVVPEVVKSTFVSGTTLNSSKDNITLNSLTDNITLNSSKDNITLNSSTDNIILDYSLTPPTKSELKSVPVKKEEVEKDPNTITINVSIPKVPSIKKKTVKKTTKKK